MNSTPKYLGPKEASKKLGVHHMTLRNWEKNGIIEAIRMPGGKRLYNVDKYMEDNINIKQVLPTKRKICYCRVSTKSQKYDLERQVNYMKEKYPNYEIIKEIGSGINLNRKELTKIINEAIEGKIEEIVIAHKDRLARFGYEMIENIINKYSMGKITIINNTKMSPEEELTKDLVSIINVFSARLNGLRKYTLKEIKEEIENK
jgi:excisionase family DNA binding protein